MDSTNVSRSGSLGGKPAEVANINSGSAEAVVCSGVPRDFDLNVGGGIDLEDEGGLHGLDLNKGVKRKLIDLNVEAVNEEGESAKKVKWFDLNVELKEEEERERVGGAVVGIPTAETETNVFVLQPPPAKVKLPPSSATLDLDGASFFDFISVYAFFRSFSTVLFLSPFEIDKFAASVVCNEPTPLFDAIHLSLMRAISRYLKREGSTSTSTCLRSLNWDLLDSITWPVFLVEYLLFHKPKHIPGLDLSELKPFEADYYTMPSSVKVAILQHLCDDLVETEVYRSELSKRTMMAESGNWKMKYFSSKGKKKAEKGIASSSGMDENGDECYLCKMDGKMICCDSCPAAMHARCVGVVTSLLPKGDWHCPECRLNQGNCYNLANSTRGTQLLGTDHHDRLYYVICHYLLVLEYSCEDECSLMVYKRDDLATVVGALNESSCVLHERIIRAIYEHWNLSHEVKRMTTLQAHSTEGCGASSSSSTEAPYLNLYEFAGMASFISEEMTSVDTTTRTPEQIMVRQLRIIQGKHALFSWSNTHNLNVYLNSKKEKCGWCFACKNPQNARDCLFITNDIIRASDVLGIQPRNGRKKHLDDIMGNIMWIENRLQGLLQDTWSNPRHSEQWRGNAAEVRHVASLKKLLLQAISIEVMLLRLCIHATNAGIDDKFVKE